MTEYQKLQQRFTAKAREYTGINDVIAECIDGEFVFSSQDVKNIQKLQDVVVEMGGTVVDTDTEEGIGCVFFTMP